jgi:hypothetical protein
MRACGSVCERVCESGNVNACVNVRALMFLLIM